MPSYRRGYSRGYRAYRGYRRYRRYRRYYRRYGGYARKFANGSSRSTIRVKVPIADVFTATQAANTLGTPIQLIAHPFYDTAYLKTSALKSPLYQLYTQLYEEVKCIGAKVKVAVTSAVGGSDIPSLQIVTAWDRRLGSGEDSATNPNYAQLLSYSTQQAVTAVNNSIAKLTRSCYASDLMEKAQWHDCSLLAASNIRDAAFLNANTNPNFFCPGLYIGFGVLNTTAQTGVNYSVDVTYYFAFRNPKYGSSASAAKSVEMRAAMADGAQLDTEEILDEGTLDEVPVRTKTNPLSVDGVHKSVRTLVGAETTKMRAEARRKAAREASKTGLDGE